MSALIDNFFGGLPWFDPWRMWRVFEWVWQLGLPIVVGVIYVKLNAEIN